MALGAPNAGRPEISEKEGAQERNLCAGQTAFGSWPLEKEACERLQLDLHKMSIRARQAPRKEALLELIDLLASLNYPCLSTVC
jgi:hypothetical protein